MTEIQIKKRYKSAGNVFNALLGIGFDPETASSFLNDINDADVVEVRHAEWIAKSTMFRSPSARNYYCSACQYEPIEAKSYCPECGAKMDGERKEQT